MNDDLKKDRCEFDIDPHTAFRVAMLIVLRLRDQLMTRTDPPPVPADPAILAATLSLAVDLINEVADSWEDN